MKTGDSRNTLKGKFSRIPSYYSTTTKFKSNNENGVDASRSHSLTFQPKTKHGKRKERISLLEVLKTISKSEV